MTGLQGSKETAKGTEIDKEEAVDEELSQPITLVGEPTTLVQTKARATTGIISNHSPCFTQL